jgi:putative transcriptional regulator
MRLTPSSGQEDGSENQQANTYHADQLNQDCQVSKLVAHLMRLGHMASSHKSLKGQLLLDGGKLRGSFFHRTVVLICQHDADGAFGLVLNRPMDNTVGEMIVADLPEQLKSQPLYLGGPVQPAAMSYLHTDSYLPQANVMPNLNLGHALDDLTELAESYSSTQKVRIFAGYAGWSPGQLDDEMRRQAWLTHPATLDLVFTPDPKSLWRRILREKGWRYRLLAESPEDPSLN